MPEAEEAPPGPARSWRSGQPLVLEGVRVRKGGTVVLDGIDLAFEPGHRYVIVGPSGSGKSTLLRLLNRLDDPTEGRLIGGGSPLKAWPVRSVRGAIGVVFQAPRPLPGSVAENLNYAASVGGEAPTDDPAARLVEVGLDPSWLDRDASGLSGGERQRLALAMSLGRSPEILALDEPTSALDPASARRVADLLDRRSRELGLRTIAVTHHRGHAALLGDRAVAMDRGKVVARGTTAEVLAEIDASTWDRDGAMS